MTSVYRDFDEEELWREYDIEATVPSLEPYIEKNSAFTAEMKRDLTCIEDLAYGPSAAEALDLYPVQNGAGLSPVVVFIHGGYWRLGSKNGSGFMAKTLTDNGIAYAPIDYALAPDVSVDEIVRQARASVVWLFHHGEEYGVDKDQIYISGSSAGGHLSAMVMAPGWQQAFDVPENLIKGAILFSGLYELEPLRHCEPNSWLKLDEEGARRNSPLYSLPDTEIPLVIAYGAEETNEFKRQSDAYAEAWRGRGYTCTVLEMSDLHHFNVTAEIADPDSILSQQLLSIIK